MANTKRFEIDMCNGPLLGKMLKFYFPLMASSMLQLVFNAADVIVVGRFAGSEALAAVGSTSALINLLTNLFIGLSVGANVMVARYYGAKKRRRTFRYGPYIHAYGSDKRRTPHRNRPFVFSAYLTPYGYYKRRPASCHNLYAYLLFRHALYDAL